MHRITLTYSPNLLSYTNTLRESQYQRGPSSIIVDSEGVTLRPPQNQPCLSLGCTGKQTGSLFRLFLGNNDLIRHLSELTLGPIYLNYSTFRNRIVIHHINYTQSLRAVEELMTEQSRRKILQTISCYRINLLCISDF